MIGLTGMLVIRDIAGIQISKFIFLAFIVFFLAVANYETAIQMLCFIFPLVCGLPGTYIMPCALALLVVKKGRINSWQLGLILFVAAMEFIAAIWYPEVDFASIVQYISFAGIMFYLIHDDVEIDYLDCVKTFFFGTSLLCAIIIVTGIISAPDNWLSLFANGKFRFGQSQVEENAGMMISLNANSLAYYSVVGVMCGIALLEKKDTDKKWMIAILLVLCFMAGFLTVSRSWMLVMAICLLIYILSKIKRMGEFLVLTVALIALLVMGIILFNYYPELIDGFIARFTADDIESGNGRFELFTVYMDAFWSNIRFVLLGTGVTEYIDVVGIARAMHNGTQQVLVCCGIIGFIVWIFGLLYPIIKLDRVHTKVVDWLPMMGVILFVQTIQFLNPMMLMLPFVVAWYSIKINQFNDKEDIDRLSNG